MDLVSKRSEAANETRRKCVDGWSIMGSGDLKQPHNFVSICASVFANTSIDDKTVTKDACWLGWLGDCHENFEFISSCLSFASGKPLNDLADYPCH